MGHSSTDFHAVWGEEGDSSSPSRDDDPSPSLSARHAFVAPDAEREEETDVALLLWELTVLRREMAQRTSMGVVAIMLLTTFFILQMERMNLRVRRLAAARLR